MKISELLEAQSMSGALKKSLSKAEPGSKIDLKIKAHNAAVKIAKGSLATTDSRILKIAPEGYKFSNPKKLVSRLVLESHRDSDRDEWDSNMPGYKGHGFGKREREDDESHHLDVPKASGPWYIRVNGKVQVFNGRPEVFFDKDVARTEARKIYDADKSLEVFVTASPNDTAQHNESVDLNEGLTQDWGYSAVLAKFGFKQQKTAGTYRNTNVQGAGTIRIDPKHGHWEHSDVGTTDATSDYEGTTVNTLERHLKSRLSDLAEGKSDFEGAKGLLNDINYDFSQIRNTDALTAKRGKGLKELLVRKYKATDFEIESEDWDGEDFQSGSFKVDGITIYFCFSEERNLALRFALKPYKQSMFET